MYTKTEQFMIDNLHMSPAQASLTHQQYLHEFGSTIQGLIHYHQVDPMLFNTLVDDALPIETLLSEDTKLQQILARFDTSKIKLWLLTNAHITHAHRVIRTLGVEQFFEGTTFCDYSSRKLVLKPSAEMYAAAERETGVASVKECFFVDNSEQNCVAARERGWKAVHFDEGSQARDARLGENVEDRVGCLDELLELFPQFAR